MTERPSDSNHPSTEVPEPARPGYRFRTPPRMMLDLSPADRASRPVGRDASAAGRGRQIWGGVVLGIGGLWLAGGTAGLLTGQRVPWIMPLLGLVLVRVGWNLRRAPRR